MSAASFSEARVCVLHGGRSGEREVSLATGAAVLEALPRAATPPADVFGVELLEDGRWLTSKGPCSPAAALEQLAGVDVFFLALHGGEGENGSIQGMLALHGLRHTGSGSGPSALGMDKEYARRMAGSLRIEVPEGECVREREWSRGPRELLARLDNWGDSRRVVKPRRGGSSVATRMMGPHEDLGQACAAVFELGDEVLIERVVEGVELTCPVLGNRDGDARALTPVEIVPAEGHFFDYVQKYDPLHQAQELCPPVSVDEAVLESLQRSAVALHACFRLDGYSRADFILPSAGGAPVFLEVNTLPGLTPQSIFPKSAAHEGLEFSELCAEIVRLALHAPSWCVY